LKSSDGRPDAFQAPGYLASIDKIESLLSGKSLEAVYSDDVSRAAFERFLEILSEASRHVPEHLKQHEPQVPWRQVADIGNYLRHAYHRVDFEVLWNIRENGNLAELRAAAERMLAKLSA
jgi:uncharacterized protein with HEPN domain